MVSDWMWGFGVWEVWARGGGDKMLSVLVAGDTRMEMSRWQLGVQRLAAGGGFGRH